MVVRLMALLAACAWLAGCGSSAVQPASERSAPAAEAEERPPAEGAAESSVVAPAAASPEASGGREVPPDLRRGDGDRDPTVSGVVSGMRQIRDASRACVGHRRAMDEGAARCMCRAVCAHRFEVEQEDGGVTEVRLPFREVDGLGFAIEADGTVPWCRYSDPGGIDVSVRCGEDGADAALTIEGTTIPATADNRRVIDFLERYRAALEARDPEAVLALASERYLDDNGTTTPTDDVSYDDLRSFMARWMASVRDVRFDARYHAISHDGPRIRVELSYEGTFTLDTDPPRTQRRADRTTVVLERHGDSFRILSGM